MKCLLTPRAVVAIAALALAAVGGNTLAADATEEAVVRPPLLAPAPPPDATAPALQAAIDLQTGLLRPPTAGERIELAALARRAAGLRRAAAASETVHADGTISAELDASLHSLTTVVVGADGQLHFSCGDAGHVHTTTVTAPAAEER